MSPIGLHATFAFPFRSRPSVLKSGHCRFPPASAQPNSGACAQCGVVRSQLAGLGPPSMNQHYAARHPQSHKQVRPPRVDRRAVELRAYAIRFDNSILDLRVVDLSYDGCAVESDERLIPGELLRLSVLGRGSAKATVRWYKDRKAGLLFEPDSTHHLKKERAAERIEVTATVGLRRSTRPNYPARVFDLTRFGCKCEFVERPEIGERLWVKFATLGLMQAKVCWIADSNVGLEFDNPLHPAVFDLLVKRLQFTK